MKAILYDVQSYERAVFDRADGAKTHQLTYVSDPLDPTTANPTLQKFSERNWRILDSLLEVASGVGRSPAEVALSWLTHRPGVTSTIIGATKLPQLQSNLAALELTLPAEASAQLDEATALDLAHPYMFFAGEIQRMVNGGTHVTAW
jgi:aryl-alcohol dehydrogenase-like predicted oxidoreductase